jgi:hypothetical protein
MLPADLLALDAQWLTRDLIRVGTLREVDGMLLAL